MMGKLDHETLAVHRTGATGAPLFQSLKQVWLSSLAPPDQARDPSAPSDIVIVSQPPPARVLP